jgi:formate dehydrogenase subunit beta
MKKRLKLDSNGHGMEEALGRLARLMISTGGVDRVFIPQHDETGEAVYATLVADVDALKDPAPLVPYINGNKGREAGLSTPKNGENKTAVFVRPCEARAIIELSKLMQAHRESMLLITSDCPGTLTLEDYKRLREEHPDHREEVAAFYAPFHGGERLEGHEVRECCTFCESLAHPMSDIRLLLVGAPEGTVVVEATSEAGERVLSKLEMEEAAEVDEAVREKFTEGQKSRHAEMEAHWDEVVHSVEDFMHLVQHCRRCYNCRAECPICYCRECVFQTATFEVTPDAFGRRADQYGVVKMPPDTLVFHLTRMNHMVTSCVSCGQCTEACPQKIPVGKIFSAVGRRVQDVFDYRAGADTADELPHAVFREDELEPR